MSSIFILLFPNDYLTYLTSFSATPSGDCEDSLFACDGMCLTKALVCNGQRNCPSGADERNCQIPSGKTIFERLIVDQRL